MTGIASAIKDAGLIIAMSIALHGCMVSVALSAQPIDFNGHNITAYEAREIKAEKPAIFCDIGNIIIRKNDSYMWENMYAVGNDCRIVEFVPEHETYNYVNPEIR